VVRASDVEPLLDSRGGRPLALVDLAIPRDIEAAVGRLQTVRLYDLDDLRSVVDEGLAQRRAEIPTVERIVDDEAERFRLWLEGRRVAPLIAELRERVAHAAHAEVRAAFERSRHDDDLDQIAERVAERIATRVLHEPVLQLKARAARDGATSEIATIRELFALSGPEQAEAG
jgi:glutamyl-tRNA reductase